MANTNNYKYDLSIVVPVAPNRHDRIRAMVSRLNLSASLHKDIKFEIILVDGGCEGLQELAEAASQVMHIKYIYLPIHQFINAAYPRNVGFRVTEGKYITMLDADYFPSENFLRGCVQPFRDHGDIINNGYVIDSNKSQYCQQHGIDFALNLNEILLTASNWDKEQLGLFEYLKIPAPKQSSHIWLAAYPAHKVFELNGYDEKFLWGYAREDDCWFYRLMKSGLPRFREAYSQFNCIHLYHPATQRSDEKNNINKQYYAKMGSNDPIDIVRNKDREWGKMLDGSFSIIGGKFRNVSEHEEFVAGLNNSAPSYSSQPWQSLDELKEYARRG